MKIEMARMGVFLVFLLAAAWQDFGTKQISSEILWLSGTAALVCQSLSVLCLAFIKEAGTEETVLWFFLNAWDLTWREYYPEQRFWPFPGWAVESVPETASFSW